jgi:hypothetical protein
LSLEAAISRHQQPERKRHQEQEEASQGDPASTGEQGETGKQADLSARRILGRHASPLGALTTRSRGALLKMYYKLY